MYDRTDWISVATGNDYFACSCRVMTRLIGWVNADRTRVY